MKKNLCCILSDNKRWVRCTECKAEWCDCEFMEDRTHQNGELFTRCPRTGRSLIWRHRGSRGLSLIGPRI